MSRRIYFDGLNLSLEHGTGIATYTRVLANVARELGYEVGLVSSSPGAPPKNPLLREISFYDPKNAVRITRRRGRYERLLDRIRSPIGINTYPVPLSGAVVGEEFRNFLPKLDRIFLARNLFDNAREYFAWSGRFVDLSFDVVPDILHCTYQLPIRCKRARNICTIHDLVPLRLPFTTLDEKRQTFRLLREIVRHADHVVTVSEQSKRDIIEILGVDESRVTNTYQAVTFPPEFLERSDDLVAEQLRGIFGLKQPGYLLFYGAIEPKKNVTRLIEAYLLSTVDIPLVITGPPGWGIDLDAQLAEHEKRRHSTQGKRSIDRSQKQRIYRFSYVSRSMLATLIRGARAVLFPSLYEGFGLPVLEAMLLGTPVVTSRTSSLPEVGGDAALYVDPYDTDDIARAIRTIAADADLRAELAARGRVQAESFSLERYRERIGAVYDRLS
ncbi:MAG TPA: glycosyltransferase family 1 protein [Stellaceae bacterium]|nr:glycosyltransferase family 1 protein [Stellaceae bacterium]